MSKVVYLLGAGASFGERSQDGHKLIKRGLPVVNEIGRAIQQLIQNHKANCHDSFTKYDKLYAELEWLKEKCELFPTIDTYAKQLFIKREIDELERLKRALSLFSSLMQSHQNRDLRYDGFVASIIQNDGSFPDNVVILSWNYDCQLDYVLHDFSHYTSFKDLWSSMNMYVKNHPSKFNPKKFSFVKLNGTALISPANSDKFVNPDKGFEFYLKELDDFYERCQNNLSFAWEEDDNLLSTILPAVEDADALVVIGYSFPYVNREIDRKIVNSMTGLNTVYIQDVAANDIVDSFESVLSDYQQIEHQRGSIKIKPVSSVRQFIIPKEL